MDPTTVRQVAEWTGGHVAGGARKDPVGPDVVIDSRKATPGSVFVAIPGERVDGHDYLGAARAAGAGVALVEHPVDDELAQVVVADTISGLSALARGVVADAVAASAVDADVTATAANGVTVLNAANARKATVAKTSQPARTPEVRNRRM